MMRRLTPACTRRHSAPALRGAGEADRSAGSLAVVDFLSGLFPAIKDIRVKQHIVEGEYVATVFDFDTTFGVIPVFDCFRVSNGKLIQIRPFYDPRPITNPPES